MTTRIARNFTHRCVDIDYRAFGLKRNQVDEFLKNVETEFGERRTVARVRVDHTHMVIHLHMDTQGITALALPKYYEGVCAELTSIMERTVRSLTGQPSTPATPAVPEQRQPSTPPSPVSYNKRNNHYIVQIGESDLRTIRKNLLKMSKVASVEPMGTTLIVTPKRAVPKTEDKKLVRNIERLVSHVGPANVDQKQVAVAIPS